MELHAELGSLGAYSRSFGDLSDRANRLSGQIGQFVVRRRSAVDCRGGEGSEEHDQYGESDPHHDERGSRL